MSVSGSKLGPFRLEQPMSGVGIGVLYRAVDDTTGQPAVVKVLNAYFSKELALVHRCFDLLGAIRSLPPHPNVLFPLAWGEQDEVVWIASGRAAGEGLDQLAVPTAPGSVLAIVDAAAAALEHALAGGIAHGDLKPSNVYYEPKVGYVQVGDFGIALLGQGADPLVRRGLKTPHPNFTAPECLEGAEFSASSDTFSLAALAFWLFTGAFPPVPGNLPGGPSSLWLELRSRASGRDTRLPSELAVVFDNALSPQPSRRPSSPAAFAEELRAAIDARPTVPVRESPWAPALAAADVETARRIYWSSRLTPGRWFTGKQSRTGWRDWLLPLTVLTMVISVALGVNAYLQRPKEIPPASTGLASRIEPQRWELSRYDLQNTAHMPVSSTSILGELRWQFRTEGPFRAAPASDGESIFVATGDNRIVALDAITGAIRWEAPSTGPVDCTPVVAGDLVFVGLRDKRIVALDRATGQLRWQFATGNPVSMAGAVDRGVLYQGSTNGVLYAIDAAVGELLWSYDAGDSIVGTPAVLDDLIVVLGDKGWIQVLDRETGRKRFDFLVVGSVSAVPVVTTDTAFAAIGGFGRRPSRLIAVDIRQSLSFLEREIYFVRGVLWLWGILEPPPPPRGSRWSASLPGFSSTSPALAQGRIFIGSATKLLSFSQATGGKEWEFTAPYPITGSPIVTDDALYAGSEDGMLYAIDPRSGAVYWSFRTGGALSTHAALAAGGLYVTSGDGSLYALR